MCRLRCRQNTLWTAKCRLRSRCSALEVQISWQAQDIVNLEVQMCARICVPVVLSAFTRALTGTLFYVLPHICVVSQVPCYVCCNVCVCVFSHTCVLAVCVPRNFVNICVLSPVLSHVSCKMCALMDVFSHVRSHLCAVLWCVLQSA